MGGSKVTQAPIKTDFNDKPPETSSNHVEGKVKGMSVKAVPHDAELPSVKNKKLKADGSVGKLLSKRSAKKVKVSKENLIWNKTKKISSEGKVSKLKRAKYTGGLALFGLVFGSVPGMIVGGIIGFCLGSDSKKSNNKKPLPAHKFSDIAPSRLPHKDKEEKMKGVLGEKVVEILMKQQPSLKEIGIVEASLKEPEAQYSKHGLSYISEYVSRAKSRTFPKTKVILNAWIDVRNEHGADKANEEMEELVSAFIKKADTESIVALNYFKEQMKEVMADYNQPELARDLAKQIETKIHELNTKGKK